MFGFLKQFASGVRVDAISKLPNADKEMDAGFVQGLLNLVFLLAGTVAVAVIVYAGIKYLSAQGQPDKVKQASAVISYGVIGLIIVVLATAIVNFVIGATK